MTDWQGNYIQSGDTISIVATRDDEGGFGWCVLETVGVLELHGTPCYAVKVTPRAYLYIDIHTLNLLLSPNDIICIKGKSDDEIAYYEEYFRV